MQVNLGVRWTLEELDYSFTYVSLMVWLQTVEAAAWSKAVLKHGWQVGHVTDKLLHECVMFLFFSHLLFGVPPP